MASLSGLQPSSSALLLSIPNNNNNNNNIPPTNRVQFPSRRSSVSIALPPRPLAVVAATAAAGRPKFTYIHSQDPIYYEMANFALSKYNRRKKTNLQLVKVVAATATFSAGTVYKLSLELKEDGSDIPMFYRASVWDRVDGVLLLNNFDPAHPDDDPNYVFPNKPKYDYEGPQYEIDKSSNELVLKLARFAFATYIDGENFDLQLVGVVDKYAKWSQVTLSRGGRGTMYSMYLKLIDRGWDMIYLARIFKNEDDDSLELEAFVPYIRT